MRDMGDHGAISEIPAPIAQGAGALRVGPWNSARHLSRVLAGAERFLSDRQLEQAPWLVVAFACGIAFWFATPSAAWWAALCGGALFLAVGTCLAAPARRRYPYLARAAIVVPLCLALGCVTIWIRSETSGEPAIERPEAGTYLGRVLAREEQPALGRDRIVVALHARARARAIRVRLNVPRDLAPSAPVRVGDIIRFRARMMPPAPPMLPGGYNFARAAWFAGLAATGAVTGPVVVTSRGGRGAWLEAFRSDLARHIRERAGQRAAGIAVALATGDRGGIEAADAQAMRDAGLAHLLSISGLHVSAVIGAVYFACLRLLALVPWLALRVRLPLVAGAAGALAGVGYTVLTGGEVPTVRSCIGAILVLAALALGRDPLSRRTLAVAAFAILLVWPESLVGPSFQMSFAAILTLIALADAGPVRHLVAPRPDGLPMRMLRAAAMLLLTGLAIELALMPIGMHHFHRAGLFGALANIVAIPLTTFVTMPLVALALCLDTIGLGGPAWLLASHSIDWLIDLAHFTASRPGAVMLLPGTAAGAFGLFTAGGLWLSLWSGRGRLMGLGAGLVGIGLLFVQPRPDILVSGDGRHVALVDSAHGNVYLLREDGSAYARDNLLEQAAVRASPLPIRRWPGAACNDDFCSLAMERGGRRWSILIARGKFAVPERALAAACDHSDVVIANRWLPGSCRPRWLKLDRAYLGQSGGVAIDLGSGTIRTVAQGEGRHGWWQPHAPARHAASRQEPGPAVHWQRRSVAQ